MPIRWGSSSLWNSLSRTVIGCAIWMLKQCSKLQMRDSLRMSFKGILRGWRLPEKQARRLLRQGCYFYELHTLNHAACSEVTGHFSLTIWDKTRNHFSQIVTRPQAWGKIKSKGNSDNFISLLKLSYIHYHGLKSANVVRAHFLPFWRLECFSHSNIEVEMSLIQ